MFRSNRAAGHRPAARPLALVGGVAVLAAAAALTVTARADSNDPAPTARLSLDELRRLPPVNAAIYHHPDEVNAVQFAKTRLTQACMARKKVPYHPAMPATGADLAATAEADLPQPFGLETAPRKPLVPPKAPKEQTGKAGDRALRALFGKDDDLVRVKGRHMVIEKPVHGCVPDAERVLLGDERIAWGQARIKLFESETVAGEKLAKDPVIHQLEHEWSSCMKEARVTASSPQELMSRFDPAQDLRGEPSLKADLVCKERTDYLQRAYPRLAAAQLEALSDDPGLLTTWYRLEKREVTAARRILAEN